MLLFGFVKLWFTSLMGRLDHKLVWHEQDGICRISIISFCEPNWTQFNMPFPSSLVSNLLTFSNSSKTLFLSTLPVSLYLTVFIFKHKYPKYILSYISFLKIIFGHVKIICLSFVYSVNEPQYALTLQQLKAVCYPEFSITVMWNHLTLLWLTAFQLVV